ncbi:hypothetical protein GCM10009715_34490 [Paeniglutamicibacter psychrophenolicus]|uniref:Transposase IS701-like DDE domain-containing protein n=1 Tax=Paeniglutamicibacter psychrophenolicus TaxID=257454 RepID=A0ABS4WA14_9MICC|nr:NF041680 family putative transposase [Paeniglutamicibacter psychrophenolicus]MBP2373037.1 hypothetical protein [Paeniglutamicibacter psychrophenolicus]
MTENPAQELIDFRDRFYHCLESRPDAQFELCDAILCSEGPVDTLVGLSQVPEHRRGYGALYDAVNQGTLTEKQLRGALLAAPLPRDASGRIVLAVDISNWLRPDAPTSPERLFCHTYARGSGAKQMIPGWPYSFIAAVEPGRTSWTRILDVRRLGPAESETEMTAGQLRTVIEGIIAAGHWKPGDQKILALFDAGYNVARIGWLLADLPLEVIGRLRSDRVLRNDPIPAPPGSGRPARHGRDFRLQDPDTWGAPATASHTETTRYGDAAAQSWNRLHPRLARRGAWEDHRGELPVIAGTLIRLEVQHLPGNAKPKPLWLWTSAPDPDTAQAQRYWQSYLRRFDLEHTFRFLKQTLGWNAPQVTSPRAGDTWTWLVVAAHTQLALARELTGDLRRPWEKVVEPHKLSPARTRRGFRYLHRKLPLLAGAPKPTHPGPGRPPGRKNRRPAIIHPVGKQPSTVK